jgi:hypothetical protein
MMELKSNLPELPQGWIWTTIGEVAETTSGGTPSRKKPDYYTGTIPWVKSGELNDGFITSVEECITQEAVEHSNAKVFPRNTTLVALYGATFLESMQPRIKLFVPFSLKQMHLLQNSLLIGCDLSDNR